MAARNGLQDRFTNAGKSTRTGICRLYLQMPLVLLIPTGALLGASGARVEKDFRAVPNCRIRITNPAGGTIVVRGWDKPEVHAVCLTNSPKVEIDSDPTPANDEAEKIDFTTHVLDPQASAQEKAASYELDIPKDSSLVINSSAGSISVEHVSGDDSIESVNGVVSVSDGAGMIQARSLNGNMNFIRPTGRVEAISIMGNLTFTASESARINAQTQFGKIAFDGDFLPIGDYILKTYAGDVTVTCPTSDSFALEAHSVRGKVDNQFKLSLKPHLPFAVYGDGAFGNNNRGDARVTVKSYTGTIHVWPRS